MIIEAVSKQETGVKGIETNNPPTKNYVQAAIYS